MTIIIKAVTETVSNNNAVPIQDDDELTTPLAASTPYRVQLFTYGQSSATAHMRVALNYTGTVLSARAIAGGHQCPQIGLFTAASLSNNNHIVAAAAFTTDYSVFVNGSSTSSQRNGTIWDMVIWTDTAGTLSLRWSQQTANASNTQMFGGVPYLKVTDLTPELGGP